MIKLSSGVDMPLIGIGTFKTKGKDLVFSTLEAALQAGYRSIDTAAVYRNEEDIGSCLTQLLPKFGLTRRDVFITSKLGPKDQGAGQCRAVCLRSLTNLQTHYLDLYPIYEGCPSPKDQGAGQCRAACLRSLTNLQTDYLDLYLIHWPGAQGRKPEDPGNAGLRQESWRDMEQLHKEGKLKAIGVSNYEQRHLEDLLSHCDIPPALLQIEHHPHLIQRALVAFCQKNKIQFQAYSSLGTTAENNKLLSDPIVLQTATSLGVSPAQVLLKWAVQQNIGVIPKSTNPDHIKTNIDIFSFKLGDQDMDKLNSLDTQHHYCWNPAAVS